MIGLDGGQAAIQNVANAIEHVAQVLDDLGVVILIIGLAFLFFKNMGGKA